MTRCIPSSTNENLATIFSEDELEAANGSGSAAHSPFLSYRSRKTSLMSEEAYSMPANLHLNLATKASSNYEAKPTESILSDAASESLDFARSFVSPDTVKDSGSIASCSTYELNNKCLGSFSAFLAFIYLKNLIVEDEEARFIREFLEDFFGTSATVIKDVTPWSESCAEERRRSIKLEMAAMKFDSFNLFTIKCIFHQKYLTAPEEAK